MKTLFRTIAVAGLMLGASQAALAAKNEPAPAPAPSKPKPTRPRPESPAYATQARCNDLLQKAALGEPVSAAEREFMATSCR